MVDQNWDRGAERAGKEGLPKVKGPLDAVAANSDGDAVRVGVHTNSSKGCKPAFLSRS